MESLNRADFIVLKASPHPNPPPQGGREHITLHLNPGAFHVPQGGREIQPNCPTAVFSYAFQELRDHASGKTFPRSDLSGIRLMAVSAIADPESFENTLKSCGADIVSAKRFLDHHNYNEKELSDLLQEAKRRGCSLVMTEKDEVKLPEGFPTLILSVRMDWVKGEKELEDALFKTIT